MSLHPEPPEALVGLVDRWRASGSKRQDGITWHRASWERRFRKANLQVEIPLADVAQVSRADVTELAAAITDEASALKAFMASMIWGYGTVGYGPFRTSEIIRLNGGPEALSQQLLDVAQVARTHGGVAAYEHVGDRRTEQRSFLRHLGPAFGTKFIYFVTRASAQPTTPVMDSVMCGWFNRNVPDARLVLDWRSTQSYRTYVEHLQLWKDSLDLADADDIEMIIFESRSSRETPADMQQAIDALQGCLSFQSEEVQSEARPHVEALQHLAERTL